MRPTTRTSCWRSAPARTTPRPRPNPTRRASAMPMTRPTRAIACWTSGAASCATTPTAASKKMCGGAISPATRSYYNIEDFSLWDYVGAMEDVQARRLRLIGDPAQRYREDPVRMLRAARFEAKLGFTLDAETESSAVGAARAAHRRAGGAPVRRDAEAVPHRPRREVAGSAAAARPARRAVSRRRALPRASIRAARSSSCWWPASPTPMSACRPASR